MPEDNDKLLNTHKDKLFDAQPGDWLLEDHVFLNQDDEDGAPHAYPRTMLDIRLERVERLLLHLYSETRLFGVPPDDAELRRDVADLRKVYQK